VQERDGAEAFVDVLHEHLTRWQKHCGVGFPAHGVSAAAAGGNAQPRAATAADGASMPARPSDSSSSLASPEAAAAYDKQLKVLTVRLLVSRRCHHGTNIKAQYVPLAVCGQLCSSNGASLCSGAPGGVARGCQPRWTLHQPQPDGQLAGRHPAAEPGQQRR